MDKGDQDDLFLLSKGEIGSHGIKLKKNKYLKDIKKQSVPNSCIDT